MIMAIDLALPLLSSLISNLTKSQAPTHIISAVQAAIDALAAHRDDLITKDNLEAQRG